MDSLRACHEKIRTFTAGLERLADLPDLADERVPAAAAQARRYFAEGLPLHAADEDLSFAPRLLRVAPESATLMADLATDHVAIEACIADLIPQLDTLAAGGRTPHATLRATVHALSSLLLPHITREEDELFPTCARLTDEDRQAIALEIVQRRA